MIENQSSLNKLAFGSALLLELCEMQLKEHCKKKAEQACELLSTLHSLETMGLAIESIEEAYTELIELNEQILESEEPTLEEGEETWGTK